MRIKMVKIAVNYITGLPKARNNIQLIQSPRQLVIGESIYLPLCQTGQYGQGICEGDNSTENEHTIDNFILDQEKMESFTGFSA